MGSDHSEAAGAGSVIAKSRGYLSDSIAELKKVSYPTRQQTIQATLVTLVIVFFVAICLFLLDLVFAKVMELIV